MTRTERLYALVEELRAVAPRTRSVRSLALRLEVSERTVQRDLQALMAAGVPVRAVTGRGGGWAIDPAMTLPPISFTPAEAATLTTALAAFADQTAARTALQKVIAVTSGPASDAVRATAARIVALPSGVDPEVRATVDAALADGHVLQLEYADAAGRYSSRDVEPAGLLTADGRWYLIAWCRTRRAARGFRLDRIRHATPTPETAPARDLPALLTGLAANAGRPF